VGEEVRSACVVNGCDQPSVGYLRHSLLHGLAWIHGLQRLPMCHFHMSRPGDLELKGGLIFYRPLRDSREQRKA
jgi:hypothetical protein